MSTAPPETITLPADLFGRLIDAYRKRGTDTRRHSELFAAAEAGHTRLTAKAAYLAAQHASRVDETTDTWPHQEEADFYTICDLIPADTLVKIHAEDQAERLIANAEYAAWRAANQTRTQP